LPLDTPTQEIVASKQGVNHALSPLAHGQQEALPGGAPIVSLRPLPVDPCGRLGYRGNGDKRAGGEDPVSGSPPWTFSLSTPSFHSCTYSPAEGGSL
jgi:hypothetical protein